MKPSSHTLTYPGGDIPEDPLLDACEAAALRGLKPGAPFQSDAVPLASTDELETLGSVGDVTTADVLETKAVMRPGTQIVGENSETAS